VRRALNLGVDRDAINQAMFGGRSEPQWGFWKQDSGLLPESLVGSFARDVNRAKALLAEAGAENLELSASVTPGDSQTVSEIIQQQWAEIGVKLTLVPTQNILQDALGPSPKTDVYFFPLVRSGLDKVTRTLVEQNVGNVCGYANPELNRFVAQLQALSPTSPEAKEAWAGLQQVAVDDAANIFGVFGMASNAWSPRVGNVEFVPNFQGVPFLDIRDAYIVAD